MQVARGMLYRLFIVLCLSAKLLCSLCEHGALRYRKNSFVFTCLDQKSLIHMLDWHKLRDSDEMAFEHAKELPYNRPQVVVHACCTLKTGTFQKKNLLDFFKYALSTA